MRGCQARPAARTLFVVVGEEPLRVASTNRREEAHAITCVLPAVPAAGAALLAMLVLGGWAQNLCMPLCKTYPDIW